VLIDDHRDALPIEVVGTAADEPVSLTGEVDHDR